MRSDRPHSSTSPMRGSLAGPSGTTRGRCTNVAGLAAAAVPFAGIGGIFPPGSDRYHPAVAGPRGLAGGWRRRQGGAAPTVDRGDLTLHYGERGDPAGTPIVLMHGLLW